MVLYRLQTLFPTLDETIQFPQLCRPAKNIDKIKQTMYVLSNHRTSSKQRTNEFHQIIQKHGFQANFTQQTVCPFRFALNIYQFVFPAKSKESGEINYKRGRLSVCQQERNPAKRRENEENFTARRRRTRRMARR